MKARSILIPAGLLTLTAVPAVAGAVRVASLAAGGPVTADNSRFFAMPLPVVVHIFSATTFLALGAFQFSPGIRRRWPRWHRWAGRVLVPSGITAAGAGLWMTLFYPHPAMDDFLVPILRLVFGSAMISCLVLGFLAIMRREVATHRAWMMRGYAIGMGAGTQVLTAIPWLVLTGGHSATGLPRALLLAAGWVINLAVVEWWLRRRRGRPARRVLSFGAEGVTR